MWISEQMRLITSACTIYSFCVVSNNPFCSFLPREFQRPTTSYLLILHITPIHRAILCLPSATSPATRRNSAIAAKESLSGLETEMRKLEGLVKEFQDELDYLKRREMRFQSTNGKSRPPLFTRTPLSPALFVAALAWYDSNVGVFPRRPILTRSVSRSLCIESTNKRVQNFALFTFVALVCLGTWQIFHLRSFFRKKYLID